MIPLVQFKDVIIPNVYKKCENMSRKTWYSLTQHSFFDYMYKCEGFLHTLQLKDMQVLTTFIRDVIIT
jgi:hypothetical protein